MLRFHVERLGIFVMLKGNLGSWHTKWDNSFPGWVDPLPARLPQAYKPSSQGKAT